MPVSSAEYKRAIDFFLLRVGEKTSWGKNEIEKLWSECLIYVMTNPLPDGLGKGQEKSE